MTKKGHDDNTSISHCRWCGRRIDLRPGRGRPRQFCRDGCRQQAYLARKLAQAHGLAEDELVVSRSALEELQSRVYCLQASLEDIDRDLGRSSEHADVVDALNWLRENAEPVAAIWIEPLTASSTDLLPARGRSDPGHHQ